MPINKIIPFLIKLGDVIPTRSKATLMNEIAIALIECINIYNKKIKKLGKIRKIAATFWPVRLIPLSETRAAVCSYLLNKTEKLDVGQFSQIPPSPENVIKGADPSSFLSALQSYNNNYLKRAKNYKRGIVIQEALFNSNEVEYFKNFFLNPYDLKSFNEPYFSLEGDPIAKSVNQVKIVQEVYDFVNLKDVNMLDKYAEEITQLCDDWIQKGSQDANKIRGTKVDTSEEEKQLTTLNRELTAEKEREIITTPEELIKNGQYKIPDKTNDLYNQINNIKTAVDNMKNSISQKELFLFEEGLKELELKYRELGSMIDRYKNEFSQLKKNVEREISDTEKAHQRNISEHERKISEVQRQIEVKQTELSSKAVSAEDIVAKIKQEKQSCLNSIEGIKDMELTGVQKFFNNYSIEIKTKDIIVGIPIFIFFFTDPNTNRSTERAPVLPIMIDKGNVVRTKIIDSFRQKIRDLMNKYNPMIDLVETEGEKNNLMEIKNLDKTLEESIEDLRMQKILSKKQEDVAKELIANIIW